MTSVDERKNALRAEFKKKRSALTEQERADMDARIAQAVCQLPAYQSADVVFSYLSFGAEVDTRAIIADAWARGKMVALPRCVPGSRVMEWFRVNSFDGLVLSSFGVEEPARDLQALVDPGDCANAVAIVPGFTFDNRGYRLGYGGGFYDVFLSGFPGTSIGLCRAVQRVDRLDALNEFDLPVDLVVTD